MKKLQILFLFFSFLIINPSSLIISSAFAQTATPQPIRAQQVEGTATMGVAHLVPTQKKDLKNGTVLSSSDNGAIPTALAYDPQVIGVVATDAAILINSGETGTVPVISTGEVYILVSAKDGKIKKGDLLASSTVPGVAVKAIRDGYVLGTALEDYDNADPKKADVIVADLNLHYFNSKPTFPGSLTDILKFVLLPTKEAPTPIYKYIVAAIVVLGSFAAAFLTFGRAAAKGVEALGRNPAASKIIHLGIIFNVGIVALIVLTGLTVAFLIMRL